MYLHLHFKDEAGSTDLALSLSYDLSDRLRTSPLARDLLKTLDKLADAVRLRMELHARDEVVTWFCRGDRQYQVEAGGYGEFTLVEFESSNPNDRTCYNSADYADEDAACAAARRLGEHGVDWDDRDTPTDDEE